MSEKVQGTQLYQAVIVPGLSTYRSRIAAHSKNRRRAFMLMFQAMARNT
jgi:hypothetical protein